MSDVFDTAAFARALERTSDAIKREVGALIAPAAQTMADRLVRRYPLGRKSHPGRLHMRDDVRVGSRQSREPLLPARRVTGPRLATIWQDGTGQRFDATRKNANRGRMPPQDPGFFQRTAIQVRADMLSTAQAILDRPREIT